MKKPMRSNAILSVLTSGFVLFSSQSGFAATPEVAMDSAAAESSATASGASSTTSLPVEASQQKINSAAAAENVAPVDAALVTDLKTEALAAPEKKASGTIQIGRSNSMYIINGNSAVASWDYAVGGGYKFSKLWSVSALLEGGQDIKDPTASDLAKGTIKTTYNGISAAEDRIIMTPSLSIGVPVSRAQYSATFQGSTAVAMKFAANPDYLISKKLSLDVSISGTRSFHKFDTAASGKVNTKSSSTQTMNLGWNFTDALSVSLQVNHYHTWSYQGALSESYNHIEEIGYALNDQWALALGHQYGNPTVSIWKADRATSNYNATDDDNSLAYGTVTYTF